MMEALTSYLTLARDQRRTPAVFDCATLPADWVVSLGMGDPMARWRGAYTTENEALALIHREGGLVSMFNDGLASIGVAPRTGGARIGDVAVVRVGGHEAGAIFTGRLWVFVGRRGLGMATVDPSIIVAIWAVHHG